jgi:hypothetical protein
VLAVPEQCNGLDDDCNGLADDDAGCGGGGQGGGTSACGLIDVLSSDFDGESLDGRFEVVRTGDATAWQAGGELVLGLGAQTSQVGLVSLSAYDARGRTMALEIAEMPVPGTSLHFGVGADEENHIGFWIDATGVLHYGYRTSAEGEQTLSTDTADPAEHRHLRLRQEGSHVFFDFSADGASWTERVSLDVADQLQAMQFMFLLVGAETEGTGSAEQVRLAGLSGPSAFSPLCEMSALQDDFDDGQRSAAWIHGWANPACTAEEQGGEQRFACEPTANNASAAIVSAARYDMTGGSCSVELTAPPQAGANAWAEIYVTDATFDDYLYMGGDEVELWLGYGIDGVWFSVADVPYNPAASPYWRMREEAGQIYWELSADGQQWSVIEQMTAPFDVGAVRAWLAGGSGNETDPVTVAFDDFNITP